MSDEFHITRAPPVPPRRRRRTLVYVGAGALALAAIVVVLAVVLVDGDPAATVKVGAIYVREGPDEKANTEVLRGAQFAVDFINGSDDRVDAGTEFDSLLPLDPGAGLPGLGGAELELVKPERASKPVTRCTVGDVIDEFVTRDGVAALVGAYESTITVRAILAAHGHKVPLVNAGSTVPSLTGQPNDDELEVCPGVGKPDPRPSPWFFRVGAEDVQAAKRFFALLEESDVSVRKVAILTETKDIFGRGANVATREALPPGIKRRTFDYPSVLNADVDVTDDACVSKEANMVEDIAAAVRAIKRYKPDVVFAAGYPPDAVTVVQTMARLRYVPPAMLVYGSGYLDDDLFVKGATRANPGCGLPPGDPCGIISHTHWSSDVKNPGGTMRRIARLYRDSTGEAMTSRAADGFSGMLTLAQAISKAGSPEGNEIREALGDLKVPESKTIMPWSGIEFDDDRQNRDAQVLLQQIIDGDYTVVYPSGSAKREPEFPLANAC